VGLLLHSRCAGTRPVVASFQVICISTICHAGYRTSMWRIETAADEAIRVQVHAFGIPLEAR
jgi:hypothetical protein